MARTSKVTTLSLPPQMVKEAERIAKEENRTKSELFREALRLYINQRRWQKIRGWGQESAKKACLKEENINDLISEVRKKEKQPRSRAKKSEI